MRSFISVSRRIRSICLSFLGLLGVRNLILKTFLEQNVSKLDNNFILKDLRVEEKIVMLVQLMKKKNSPLLVEDLFLKTHRSQLREEDLQIKLER